MHLLALAERKVEIFETLMAILHFLSHCSRSLRYFSRYLMSSAGYDSRVIHVES